MVRPAAATPGVILALKGRSAAAEVADAGPELAETGLVVEQLSVSAHPTLEPATVIRLSSD